MKLFGSLKELVSAVFRKNSQEITLRPNQTTTYTAARDVQLPEQDSNAILVSRNSTDTLTNKTIDAASNTISNISLTTGVTGVLPTANGGTGQNSTATFPTSGSVATVPASGVVKSNGTVLSSSNVSLTTEVTGILPSANGGTGVNNAGTLTYGSNNITITTSGSTSLTVPTSGTVATLVGTEQLTNKDIDGGTASNTSRITVPKAATATLSGLTRKQATILYDTDTNELKYDNGSSLVALGAASTATPTSPGIVTSYTATIQSSINSVSSADYTGTTTDGYQAVLFSTGASNRTYTVPLASANIGRRIIVRKTDSGTGTVILARSGSDTISGLTSVVVPKQDNFVEILAVASNTWVVTQDIVTPVIADVHRDAGTETTVTAAGSASTVDAHPAFGTTITDNYSAIDGSGIFTVPTGMGGVYQFSYSNNYRITSIGSNGDSIAYLVLIVDGATGTLTRKITQLLSLGGTTPDGAFGSLNGLLTLTLTAGQTVRLYGAIDGGTGGGTYTWRYRASKFGVRLVKRF